MDPHLRTIAIFVVALLSCGCDAALTKTGPDDQPDHSSIELQNRVAQLSEQNAELIQMLEEAESKINRILSEQEYSAKELAETKLQLAKMETQCTAAKKQLEKIGQIASDIRTELTNSMSATASKLESLNALLAEPEGPDQTDEKGQSSDKQNNDK